MSPSILRNRLLEFLRSPISRLDLSALADMYRGVDHQYILFWEDNVPALYDHVSQNKSSSLIRLNDIRQSKKLPYNTAVFVAGPQLYQRVFQVDIAAGDIPEWIIEHRHQVWPAGIDDELLDFSYTLLESTANIDIYFCFINKETIRQIESYCEKRGLIPVQILPRASLLFAGDNYKAILEQSNRSLVRGKLVDNIELSDGYFRIHTKLNSNEYWDNPGIINDGQAGSGITELNLSERLISFKNGSSLADMNLSSRKSISLSFSIMHRIFKLGVFSLLSMLIILVSSNIYLSIKESKSSGILTELKILMANSELLRNKIGGLEDELNAYTNLLDRHSSYGEILAGLASMSPDSLWYRHLEITDDIGGGSTVTIKGYSVDRSQVAQLAHALEGLTGVTSVDIVSLGIIAENVPDDIPFAYQKSLYRYSLKLEVSG